MFMYVFGSVRDTMKAKKSATIASACSRRRFATSRRRGGADPQPPRRVVVRSEDAATGETEGVQWDLVNRPHTSWYSSGNDLQTRREFPESSTVNPIGVCFRRATTHVFERSGRLSTKHS